MPGWRRHPGDQVCPLRSHPLYCAASRPSLRTVHPIGDSTHGESARHQVHSLPYSLKILLENLLRFEDGVNVTREDIEALLELGPEGRRPTRDLLHAGARDHAGLHRRALRRRPRRDARGDDEARRQPEKINPLAPAELVIDHSVQVDHYGTAHALAQNTRSSSSATASAMRSCAGARRLPQLQGRAAEHRHRPPGQPRVPRRASCSTRTRRRASPIPTPWSAPTRTPR
jgi:hypothetical protein